MNKYEKILEKMGKILGFLVCITPILLLLTMSILILCFEAPREAMGIGCSLILESALFMSIHGISYFLGMWFLKDEYRASHVSHGETIWWPKKSYKYIKRNMITNFIEIIVSLIFTTFYTILLCIWQKNIVICLVGLILSLFSTIIFYLFYKKQQYQLKNESF